MTLDLTRIAAQGAEICDWRKALATDATILTRLVDDRGAVARNEGDCYRISLAGLTAHAAAHELLVRAWETAAGLAIVRSQAVQRRNAARADRLAQRRSIMREITSVCAQAVAEASGVPVSKMLSPTRVAEVVRAKQLAYELAYDNGASFVAIARYFDVDPGTVQHGKRASGARRLVADCTVYWADVCVAANTVARLRLLELGYG